uniref:NBS-LRR disease-resistance protein scn3r1 [Glycine max] n=1 Tax=Cajanus cajan TaxID=3821 RepID=A0A127ZNN4_CAJCA|nr:NBS-LRR disease-resistance protein scn3r1 [Glycine max] FRAGMENT [Cajanus cajan]
MTLVVAEISFLLHIKELTLVVGNLLGNQNIVCQVPKKQNTVMNVVSVVSFVLDHLSQLVAHEARLLSGVEDKVKSLEKELQMINVFLRTTIKALSASEVKKHL